MDRELIKSAEQFHIRHRQRSAWKKLVSVLGCIVVFCTTYALILPAITMERETICGFREHQHSDGCYTQQVVKQMLCSAKDMGVHTHSAECGSSCGYADFMIHEHDASCYDGSGRLVCTLPQVKEHTHSTDCYRIPQIVVGQHTHTDACYSMQQAELLCALAESDGHTHTEGCMSQISNLVCALEESEEHAHSATCYSTETVLSCEEEEMQAHHHTEDCYCWENKLSCGKEEGPVYGPGEPELSCTQKEVKAHTHTAQCFNTDGNWICGQPQILRHVHTQSCFDTSQTEMVLTCDLEEHTHTQACFAEATETTEETTEATEETTEVTEETTEATEETTEATEEEQTMPAQSFRGLTESNVVVLADADAGAFPAGTTMYASDVAVATARNLAEESADEDTEILDAVGVNITFRDAEGTIIEPENGALVRVNIVLPEEKKLEGDDFSLLHRHNDGTVETVETAEVNSDGAEFDAESFSIYVVTAMGDKHKSEVHANRTGSYYLNGPYKTNSAFRPYVLAIGDSVTIYADFDQQTDCNPFFFYANQFTGQGVYVDASDNEEIITVGPPTYTRLDNEKIRTSVTITAKGLNPVTDSTRQGAENQKDNPFNDAHFSLFAISFGQPTSDNCSLSDSFNPNAPTDAQKENIENVFFVRFVDKVFVESIGGSDELFVDYYDHADLEIDNSGHFTGKRTIYYLDKTEVETTTYSAAVQQVNSCTLYRTENRAEEEKVPVYYCTDKTGNATLNDVCKHGDNAYKNVDPCYSIETRCYVDNNAPIGSTQYEYTSKFGHIRFSNQAYCASFNFNLFLKPMSRTTTILETGQTTTLDKPSVDDLPGLTSTGATTDLDHQSFVDAYNFCPDHSGLDFHISGDISAKIDFKFDPVSVYLGAKKQLTGKDLEAREFSFVLKEGDTVLQTVSNDADGIIRFDPLNFSQAGTYNYTIEEVVPNSGAPGIVYDNSKVNVRIEVTGSSENANMAAKIYYNNNGKEYESLNDLPVFKNKYEGNLIIQKNVVGKAVDPTERFHLTIRRMDGAFIDWSKFTVESDKDRSIALSGNDYQNYLDIYGGEQITIHGLPAGKYSIQEWGAPATVVYTKVTEQGEAGNQSEDPLWSNPRDPNDPKGWWYFAGVVELTAEASNATQRITNKFCKLAVTKRVVGDKAPADVTSYKVKITRESEESIDWRVVKATSSIVSKTVNLTVNKTNPTNEKDQGYSVSFMLVKDETVTLTNLPVGTYKVVEEDPLTGVLDVDYSTPEGKVTLIAGSTVSETITNWYPNSYILPETGGPGTGRYTLGGFTMAAGAVLWLCYRRKRRREGG